MSLSDLKSKYSRKYFKDGERSDTVNLMKKYYPYRRHEPHDNYIYGFLGLIYDGYNTIDILKKQMRLLFISSTQQMVIEDDDVENYLQYTRKKGIVKLEIDETLNLTREGKRLVESSYFWILHTSYWMRLLFREKTVMLSTALFLIIISILKILIGIQLASQGMLTEGIENLTDLVKIGIIAVIGIKLKRDKIASIIIILMMMLTGVTMIWSSIEALLEPKSIIPTIQAYIVGFISIILNLGLMFLKGMVGRTSGNISLLSDSKDSELNVKISVGVLIGLTFAIFKFYFVDAIVGIIIAIFIFKEGIEIILELIKEEEEFDITAIKVMADHVYDNRLTGYLLGSIRRDRITRSELISNFKRGLALGRLYYGGFADFFYDDLGPQIAEKHLDKLIEGDYIEMLNDEIILTQNGMKAFYDAKVREYRFRSSQIMAKRGVTIKSLFSLVFFILLIVLIFYANDINLWLSNV